MKLTKRPTIRTAEEFMGAAPDAAPAQVMEKPKRSRKTSISHTIPGDLLARLDERATALGQSRAALINLYIAQGLDRA